MRVSQRAGGAVSPADCLNNPIPFELIAPTHCKQVGLSAQAALVPRTCWSLKAARFGAQFEWYRGYCVCKARLKVI